MKYLLNIFLLIFSGALMLMFIVLDIQLIREYSDNILLVGIFNILTIVLLGSFYNFFIDSLQKKPVKRIFISMSSKK